jgi:hypothetical protein
MMREKREADAAPAPTAQAERRDTEYDAAGQPKYIEAVIDGKSVSWLNSLYSGAPEATPAPSPKEEKTGGKVNTDSVEDTNTTPNLGKLMPGDWVRHAYYNAEEGVANGVTFLNNMGGSASGVFD